jgi:hypothetical protein
MKITSRLGPPSVHGGTNHFVKDSQDGVLEAKRSWGYPKMVLLAELESTNLLEDDVLRVRVEIQSVTGGLPVAVKFLDDSHYVYGGYSASSFIQSRCETRNAVVSCDVHIHSNSGCTDVMTPEVIAAHKYVLAVHSSVFRARFKTGMQEASNNTVTINDFPAPVVRAFVSFLYEDRCSRSILREHALQLWRMADKYEVAKLAQLCEHYLGTTVSAANAIELLVLAEEYSMGALRTKALAFVHANASSVLKEGHFPDLTASLVKDLFRELAAK